MAAKTLDLQTSRGESIHITLRGLTDGGVPLADNPTGLTAIFAVRQGATAIYTSGALDLTTYTKAGGINILCMPKASTATALAEGGTYTYTLRIFYGPDISENIRQGTLRVLPTDTEATTSS